MPRKANEACFPFMLPGWRVWHVRESQDTKGGSVYVSCAKGSSVDIKGAGAASTKKSRSHLGQAEHRRASLPSLWNLLGGMDQGPRSGLELGGGAPASWERVLVCLQLSTVPGTLEAPGGSWKGGQGPTPAVGAPGPRGDARHGLSWTYCPLELAVILPLYGSFQIRAPV